MKNLTLCMVILAAFTIAACGGSSVDGTDGTGSTDAAGEVDNSPTPTPTGDNTKAISEATMRATKGSYYRAAEEAIGTALDDASAGKSVTAKTGATENIDNYRYYCFYSGSVYVNGSLTTSCTDTGGDWSCTDILADMQLQFDNCEEAATVDGTSYMVFLNGNGTAAMTGSVTGTSDSTFLDLSGNASGTLTATGDADGTVTLDLDMNITGSDMSPEVECSGTASIVSEKIQEVCGVTSDCSSCSQ